MAKVYALMEFTGPDGEQHAVGDEVDLPRGTDQQKAEFDLYIAREIVSTHKPAEPEGDAQEEGQRSPRGRR